MDPSTTTRYLPLSFFTVSSKDFSAALPEGAMIVSW
jgi:hypothetical protein